MSDDLNRAVDARIDSYRPDAVPPFTAIEGRKHRRDRRRLAVGAGVLSVVAVAGAVAVLPSLAGGGDRLTPEQAAPGGPRPAPSARPAPAAASCDAERELLLGHVPAGWDAAFQPGPGGGGTDPAAAGHWAARTPGQYVQVTRGRTLDLAAPFRQLTVLGEPAQAGQIHDGLGIDFRLCQADYQLQGYGIDASEFHFLAESLATAPPTPSPYPYTDCNGLRPGDPLDFTNLVCAPEDLTQLRTIDCIDGIYVHLVRSGRGDLEGIVGRTPTWKEAAPADPTHGRTPWAFENCKEHE